MNNRFANRLNQILTVPPAKAIELDEHRGDRRREKSLPINRCTHWHSSSAVESGWAHAQLFAKKQQQACFGAAGAPRWGAAPTCRPATPRPAPTAGGGAGIFFRSRILELTRSRRGAARCHCRIGFGVFSLRHCGRAAPMMR